MAFLKSDQPLRSVAGFPLERLTEELDTRSTELREIVCRGNIQELFADTIESTFFHTEAKRSRFQVKGRRVAGALSAVTTRDKVLRFGQVPRVVF